MSSLLRQEGYVGPNYSLYLLTDYVKTTWPILLTFLGALAWA